MENKGMLFLIVGNSGSGKDSIIKGVKEQFPKEYGLIKVPKRVITRPPSPETEDYESVSESEFLELKNAGEFILDWHIYGLYYGVRKEILDWIKEGDIVLINVSRTIIDDARKKLPYVKIVFVQVPFEVTAKRIKERGREDEEEIKERLERARKNQTLPGADFVVDNSGELDNAINQLIQYIIKEVKKKKERIEK
ncbi:MAG: phosphonate metabolism protein/1,5-bisphosphokinase (PRPP-forming) PhnN [Promethearchaeota archaeon]